MNQEERDKLANLASEISQLQASIQERIDRGHAIPVGSVLADMDTLSKEAFDLADSSTRVPTSELIAKWSEPQKVGTDGFVRLVDVMGDDGSIVQAARTSYGKGTKKVSEDRGLIRYLMRHWHTTPFEMCEIKLHVRVPMDIWRQWIRHRTASVNEYSTRYSEAIDSRNTTLPGEWRLQSKSNKQGSSGLLKDLATLNTVHETPESMARVLTSLEARAIQSADDFYKSALQVGVAREQARKNLPLSTYTEAYWKVDLHNLFHFLRLRLDSHAQQEIREFGEAIANIVKEWVPLAWEAFEEYRLGSEQFSAGEMKLLRLILYEGWGHEQMREWDDDERAEILGDYLESKRERIDFWRKIGMSS